jgi:hypothetical protein
MSWHRREPDWPRRRTDKMFRESFDVRLIHLIFDLADEPLIYD